MKYQIHNKLTEAVSAAVDEIMVYYLACAGDWSRGLSESANLMVSAKLAETTPVAMVTKILNFFDTHFAITRLV